MTMPWVRALSSWEDLTSTFLGELKSFRSHELKWSQDSCLRLDVIFSCITADDDALNSCLEFLRWLEFGISRWAQVNWNHELKSSQHRKLEASTHRAVGIWILSTTIILIFRTHIIELYICRRLEFVILRWLEFVTSKWHELNIINRSHLNFKSFQYHELEASTSP